MGVVDFGSAGWDQVLNGWLATHDISYTDWSSDGISYKNGCTPIANTLDGIKYRIIQLGDSKILCIAGWFNAPVLNTNQEIVAFNLPISVVSQFNKFGFVSGSEHSAWEDTLVTYDLNRQTGDFSIYSKSANATAADAGYSVNFGLWV